MEIRTPQDWIAYGDKGGAAMTIWAVMTDNIRENGMEITSDETEYYYGVPKHTGSFYRCYKLLKLFPQWRGRLSEVSGHFPEWKPFVRDWAFCEKEVNLNPMSYKDDENGEEYSNEKLRVLLLNLYRESKNPEKYSPSAVVKKELPKPTTQSSSDSAGEKVPPPVQPYTKPVQVNPAPPVVPSAETSEKKYFGDH
jgi:hypothetical protein